MNTRIMHAVTLAAWLALFALQLAWWAWLAPPAEVPRLVPVVVFAGPLLIVLRGLLHERPRAHFWFAVLVLPYFAVGVAAAYAAAGMHWLAWTQVCLSVAAFTAAFLYSRN